MIHGFGDTMSDTLETSVLSDVPPQKILNCVFETVHQP